MSRYRKIEVKTWSDDKFRSLSSMPASGKGLWLFLMTGPHTGPIPGLFRAGRAAMAEELDWDIEAFDEAFNEVYVQGMAKADFKARLVWLPNALKHNKPESPNVVRSWRVELELLPECELKREAIAHIRNHLESIGDAYVEAFDEIICGEKKPSRKPSPKPMPNQEQEQEQEQEQSTSKSLAPLAAKKSENPKADASPSAPPKPSTGTRLPADWKIPKPWEDWATSERPDLAVADIRREADCFSDYWHSKAGADARKLDWEATWRNWIRRCQPRSSPGNRGVTSRRGPTPDNFSSINYGVGGKI